MHRVYLSIDKKSIVVGFLETFVDEDPPLVQVDPAQGSVQNLIF
jgi:hypothetical protein